MDEWESAGVSAMESTDFELWYGGRKHVFQPVTSGFGEYYPYRDACDKKGDPKCHNSTILYYTTSFFPREANTSLIVRHADDAKDILKDVISSKQKLYLYKKDINCSGGNAYSFLFFISCSESCAKECERRSGLWDITSNTCVVDIFLTRICLRVTYHNDTDSWSLDKPS